MPNPSEIRRPSVSPTTHKLCEPKISALVEIDLLHQPCDNSDEPWKSRQISHNGQYVNPRFRSASSIVDSRVTDDICEQSPRTRLSTTRARRLTATGTFDDISGAHRQRYGCDCDLQADEADGLDHGWDSGADELMPNTVSRSRRPTDTLPSTEPTLSSEGTTDMPSTAPCGLW